MVDSDENVTDSTLKEFEEIKGLKDLKDLSPIEKIRFTIRYKGWFDSCLNGTPLRSPAFTQAAWIVYNTILKRPRNAEEDEILAETYAAWHISAMEGKPMLDPDTVAVARKVREIVLSPDGRNVSPEFG